jgi:acyl-CoA synthetase (AMP-forming)/AMP-acid ligase II
MKSIGSDGLLDAWESTLRARDREGEAPAEPRVATEMHGSAEISPSRGERRAAIFDTSAKVLRTFIEIEEESRNFERELLRGFREGEVIAIQAGNHVAWPALLLASLRKGLIALPLERTMAERERDVALRICRAAAILEVAGSAIALETHLRHHGGAPRDSFSQRAAPGRLHTNL